MAMAQDARDFQAALVERIEGERARRENRAFVVGALFMGALIVTATVWGPVVAALLSALLNGG